MEQLIQLLHTVHPLTPPLERHLRSKIKPHRFKKGDTIVAAGKIASHILFIEKGLIRSYSVEKGERISNYFMHETDIIISIISFFRRTKATDSIEALEDCICWGISWEELEETYEKFPEFNIHGRKICQNYYCHSEERWESQRRKTTKQKYLWLLAHGEKFLPRVNAEHMASYLNVSPSTFYRMKRNLRGRKKTIPPKTVK